MAQRLHVVSCVDCSIFQVQIVKKINKWECKICRKKQSLLKVFGEGSGPECRKICQALNSARGKLEEDKFTAETKQLYAESQEEFEDDQDFYNFNAKTEEEEQRKGFASGLAFVPESDSKWAKYSEEDQSQNDFLFK